MESTSGFYQEVKTLHKKLTELFSDSDGILNRVVWLSVLVGVVSGLPIAVIFFSVKDIIEGGISNTNIAIYLGLFFASFLLLWRVRVYLSKRAVSDTYLYLGEKRVLLGDHLKKLSMGYFSSKESMHLSAIMTQDFDMLEMSGITVLDKLYRVVIGTMVAFLFLIFINWKLTLASFIGIPLALRIIFSQTNEDSTESQRRQFVQGELSSNTVDFVSGIKEVKSFGKTKESFKKMNTSINEFRDCNLSLVRIKGRKIFNYKLALSVCLPIVLFLGAYFYSMTNEISLAIAVLFLIVALRLYTPIEDIGSYHEIYTIIKVSIDRMYNVFRVKPLLENKKIEKMNRFDIEFKDVSFSYDNREVLSNINMKVKEKSMTALVGHSGSGKTTVTNLIARFWDVNHGSVMIGGDDVRDIDSKELLSHISMVFQDVFLFNDSIMNNIRFAKPEASDEEVFEAACKARCHEFIMTLPNGYNTEVGEGGKKLSGGEKQRISIARAILKDAEIVLLDEATANIDPENELVIQRAIDALVVDKTIVIIAHKMSTIKNADQIIVLDEGEVSQVGNHSELVAVSGIYKNYWMHREKASGWKIAN